MIGIGSDQLLCARCSQLYPGVVAQAEKEVLREIREETRKQLEREQFTMKSL